jgi:hypothetical protein
MCELERTTHILTTHNAKRLDSIRLKQYDSGGGPFNILGKLLGLEQMLCCIEGGPCDISEVFALHLVYCI